MEEETWISLILINYRFKYFGQIWSRFSGKVDLPAHFAVYSTVQPKLEWNWHYFIYLQLIIHWLIKHFTVIYGDANKQVLTLNINIFCCEKNSLSGTPISLPKIADLLIWAQEKITCMLSFPQGKSLNLGICKSIDLQTICIYMDCL